MAPFARSKFIATAICSGFMQPIGVVEPHQFRTRNSLNETQQTRSKSNETKAKSTKLFNIPPLITVWLQVRVLPGPPAFAREASEGSRAEAHLGEGGLCTRATTRQAMPNQNIENNPMQSSRWL